jgi:formylglycine-generating enzyme required for sulfatase activity
MSLLALFVVGCSAPALSQSAPSSPAEQPLASAAFRDCPGCPEMVRVSVDVDGERRTLAVARYELTWEEYLIAFDEAGCPPPRNCDDPGSAGCRMPRFDPAERRFRDRYPMTSIMPSEIGCYLGWISRKSGKPYRLPTEAEWMAIARIGVTLPSLPLDAIDDAEGYLRGTRDNGLSLTDPRTALQRNKLMPVGQFRPNVAGIYDLFGNAGEIVSDESYVASLSPKTRGQPVRTVVTKGGRWMRYEGGDFIAGRVNYLWETVSFTIGFRLVYEDTQHVR